MIIVTTNEVAGYGIEAVLGEVMGMTVRAANIGANFVAGFRAIGGGEVTEYTKLVYESRNEVMNRMWADAQQRGANAIIGMRFDTGDIGQNFTEICAYGTAVVVRPLADGEAGATTQSIQQAVQSGHRPAAPQQARPGQGQPAPQPSGPAPQPSGPAPQPSGPQPGVHGYSPQVPPPQVGPPQVGQPGQQPPKPGDWR
ncbi:heavy metal-binding domain-containing protein [Microlunatus elymi]|uniref:UPF0145 protein FOE78_03550 n=1 Tax=Microlunatus elymi TaxID=2596828 RepID=A0A516PVG9_9ACTN|nr:YbjQ family protein [Microlunatus elymi]QDP95112.1 heavy metal-binding domain-containing protein [Microlunatus elymi]